jgi:phosphate binding protein
MKIKAKKNLTMAVLIAGALFVTQPTEAQTKLPPVKPADAKGNIVSGGSSTVFPLSQKIAEQFRADGFKDNITIDNIGSGAGIARFCRGELDIANSSRAMKAEEIDTCKKSGIEPIQFQVGVDALTIAVARNSKINGKITREQLGEIFSGKTKTWKEVNAAWPADAIKLFSPGTDSGTFDYFTEEVYKEEKDSKKRKAIVSGAPGIQLSEDDNILVQGVSGSPSAVGYFGYAYYIANKAKLKPLAYEGVLPSDLAVQRGTYKFSRPLYIITTAKTLKNKPQVAAFVNYYLANLNKVIKRVGYFPPPILELNKGVVAYVKATK